MGVNTNGLKGLPSRILLVDRLPAMVAAWDDAFHDCAQVEAICSDYFAHRADGMVSPANSFGIMDGGLDLAIRDRLGVAAQQAAQSVILEKHHGEMHVGQAEVVRSGHADWPFLIVAPTMRVPQSVARTTHAYSTFRAVLMAVSRFNTADSGPKIDSLVCPGLGTGIGSMQPLRCAVQMRMAYQNLMGPARIPSFQQIRTQHKAMVQA